MKQSCHIYAGVIDSYGYGIIYNQRYYKAHRVVYEHEVGAIPTGLVINHLCRNRRCINVKHLEVTTHRNNILTGVGNSARNAKKTHCKQGHEYNSENTHVTAKGWRVCKQCRRKWFNDRYRAGRVKRK